MKHGIDIAYTIGAQDFRYYRQTILPMENRPYMAPDGLRLVRIRHGSCIWHISGRDCTAQAGDYLLFNQTESRRQMIMPGNKVVQEVIRFAPHFVWQANNCISIFYRRGPADARNLIRATEHDCTQLNEAFDTLSCECREPSPYQQQAVYGQLIYLLAVLNRVCPWNAQKTGQENADECDRFYTSDHYRIVCGLMTYMQEHLDGDLSVGALAAVAGLSRSTLSRAFNYIVGSSIPQYTRALRLRAVNELVHNQHINQLDAALACGFGSASGYYRARQEFSRE